VAFRPVDLRTEMILGCNTFDYLIEGAKVTAVDLNAAQIALTDLKAAAIQSLEFKEFFRIFAKNDIALLREKYESVLRPLLLEKSAAFWDEKISRQFFEP
jgi:betaine lipid synthase